MAIERQGSQYAPFVNDAGIYAARDRKAVHDEADVASLLRGPSIHAGLLERHAVDVSGMDPDSHAYHQELPPGPGGEWMGDETGHPAPQREYNPFSGYEPTSTDEHLRELVGEDDDSGYNWGPEPDHDPGIEPGPHPDFHGDAPHPIGTPTYLPNRPSFSAARSIELIGGPAFTALAVPSAQPQQPAEPVWLGHTFAPSHRVGLPWRDQLIQGTVTYLDGTDVGVRWDDGQHSVEEPSAIRPLY